jgi:hypothetical protein
MSYWFWTTGMWRDYRWERKRSRPLLGYGPALALPPFTPRERAPSAASAMAMDAAIKPSFGEALAVLHCEAVSQAKFSHPEQDEIERFIRKYISPASQRHAERNTLRPDLLDWFRGPHMRSWRVDEKIPSLDASYQAARNDRTLRGVTRDAVKQVRSEVLPPDLIKQGPNGPRWGDVKHRLR